MLGSRAIILLFFVLAALAAALGLSAQALALAFGGPELSSGLGRQALLTSVVISFFELLLLLYEGRRGRTRLPELILFSVQLSACVLLFGRGLPEKGESLEAIAVFSAFGVAAWWLAPASGGKGAQPDRTSWPNGTSLPNETAQSPLSSPASSFASPLAPPLASSLAPSLADSESLATGVLSSHQRWIDEEGVEHLIWRHRAVFRPEQQTMVLHIPFSPPLRLPFQATMEAEGNAEPRCRVTLLNALGARGEVKIAKPLEEETQVDVEIHVTSKNEGN